MTSTLGTITFDAATPARLQDFWAAALGYERDACSDDWALLTPPGGGLSLYFQKVPEGKTAKNRLHLDLEHADPDAEAARLVGLGATMVNKIETWVVMQDPEGNEFCVTQKKG